MVSCLRLVVVVTSMTTTSSLSVTEDSPDHHGNHNNPQVSHKALCCVLTVLHYILVVHGHFNISTFLDNDEAEDSRCQRRKEQECAVIVEVTYCQEKAGRLSIVIHSRFYKDNDFACSSNNKYLRKTIPTR